MKRARLAPEAGDWDTMVPWRRSELRHAGFDAQLAGEIAADLRYDLRAILDLIERGCAPRLAVRILAPLDRPRR
ncbi:MAG TPA: hypothetical protein VGM33_07055 [Baekduia sp.]|jgi:hypothetical protein